MNTEQKLIETLQAAKAYEASPDLWERVVHSIDEDRLHRRRVWTTLVGLALVLITASGVAMLAVTSREIAGLGSRYRIDWRAMEIIELTVLGILVAVLAPTIRRFGRGYVTDIFHSSPRTGDRLLQLLDVAYYLVFSGYVLSTVSLSAQDPYSLWHIGEQIQQASIRVGGLLILMGLLHAAALVAMPMIGLVFNATRRGRKLPRWVTVILIVVAALVALNLPALLLAGA